MNSAQNYPASNSHTRLRLRAKAPVLVVTPAGQRPGPHCQVQGSVREVMPPVVQQDQGSSPVDGSVLGSDSADNLDSGGAE